MKFFLTPEEPTWWAWLVTALLLAAGVAGREIAFAAAILLSAAQSVFFLWRHRAATLPVQIRFAFTVLLLVCFAPVLRPLYWLPTVGTFARVLLGYCLMARVLLLLPINRMERLSLDYVCRAFLTPPVRGLGVAGLPASGCPGGECSVLEPKIGRGQLQGL